MHIQRACAVAAVMLVAIWACPAPALPSGVLLKTEVTKLQKTLDHEVEQRMNGKSIPGVSQTFRRALSRLGFSKSDIAVLESGYVSNPPRFIDVNLDADAAKEILVELEASKSPPQDPAAAQAGVPSFVDYQLYLAWLDPVPGGYRVVGRRHDQGSSTAGEPFDVKELPVHEASFKDVVIQDCENQCRYGCFRASSMTCSEYVDTIARGHRETLLSVLADATGVSFKGAAPKTADYTDQVGHTKTARFDAKAYKYRTGGKSGTSASASASSVSAAPRPAPTALKVSAKVVGRHLARLQVLAADASGIYWGSSSTAHLTPPAIPGGLPNIVDNHSAHVWRMAATGGKPRAMAGHLSSVVALATDAKFVYAMTAESCNKCAPQERVIRLSKSAPVRREVLFDNFNVSHSLALDGKWLYVISSGSLYRIPKDGSAAAAPIAKQVSASTLFADAANIVVADGGSIRSVLATGGKWHTLYTASSRHYISAVAVQGGYVYALLVPSYAARKSAGKHAGELVRIPDSGGAAKVVSSRLHAPQLLVSTGATLFFVQPSRHGELLERVTPTGGSPVALAEQGRFDALVFDGANLVWATGKNVVELQGPSGKPPRRPLHPR